MEYLDCPACSGSFGEYFCPKVLECGHSICSTCLSLGLAYVKFCPSCRKPYWNQVEYYPTNFNLLEVIEYYNRFKDFEKNPRLPELVLKQKLFEIKYDLLEKKAKLMRTIHDKIDAKLSIDNDIEAIEKLLNKEITLEYNEAEDVLLKAECDLEQADEILCLLPNPELIKVVDIYKYSNAELFLQELLIRLEDRQAVFSCKVFCEPKDENYHFQWRCGNITIDKDWIFLHCLSSSMSNNIRCITLQDLKRCMRSREIVIFIDVGTQNLRFTPINSSSLTLNFIKLCTGEEGQRLMGATATLCDINNNLEENYTIPKFSKAKEGLIKGCFRFDAVITGHRDYRDYDITLYSEKVGVTFSKGDIIIQYYQTYICVTQVADDKRLYKNVVAKLQKDCAIKFSDLKMQEVLDCGISFPFDIKNKEQFKN